MLVTAPDTLAAATNYLWAQLGRVATVKVVEVMATVEVVKAMVAREVHRLAHQAEAGWRVAVEMA